MQKDTNENTCIYVRNNLSFNDVRYKNTTSNRLHRELHLALEKPHVGMFNSILQTLKESIRVDCQHIIGCHLLLLLHEMSVVFTKISIENKSLTKRVHELQGDYYDI